MGIGKVRFSAPLSSHAYLSVALVTFTAATTYDQAVHLVTDLGLWPVYPCYSQTAAQGGLAWAPSDEASIYALIPAAPTLWVSGLSQPAARSQLSMPADPLAAPDWLARLGALSAVQSIDENTWSCPLLSGNPGDGVYLNQPPTPSQDVSVTFTPNTSYSQAIMSLLSLGYRLADPCYEAASTRAVWRPMGQETRYATTATLVVALTERNSSQWRTQTQRLSDVVSLTVAAPQAACTSAGF